MKALAKTLLKGLVAIYILGQLMACEGESAATSGRSAGDVTLSWTAPSARDNNTGISMAEIAAYHVYYGVESGEYSGVIQVDDASTPEVNMEQLPPGTYFVVITTVDTEGRESKYSDEYMVLL